MKKKSQQHLNGGPSTTPTRNKNSEFKSPALPQKSLTPQSIPNNTLNLTSDNPTFVEEEIIKIRTLQLKKEEAMLTAELEKLKLGRDLHVINLRRINQEDESRFLKNNRELRLPNTDDVFEEHNIKVETVVGTGMNKGLQSKGIVLKDRYLILELIGKGGFSEGKAFATLHILSLLFF